MKFVSTESKIVDTRDWGVGQKEMGITVEGIGVSVLQGEKSLKDGFYNHMYMHNANELHIYKCIRGKFCTMPL